MKKQSIALVWPKTTFLEHPMTWMPLGLMYLGAQLEKLGHNCEFFDLNVDEMPKDGDFDQLWLSCTSPQIREARAIGIATAGWKTKRVLGGALPWANPESAKKLEFDLIVGGEADYPPNLEKILQTVEAGSERYINVPVAKDLLWSVPPLRRWAHKYHSYMTDLSTGQKHRMSSIFGTRGCSMSCAFCIDGEQRVLMADWTWKKIKDIIPGDYVMSMDGGHGTKKNAKIIPTKVLNVFDKGIKETIVITDNTNELRLTPDHKIYADDSHGIRWKRADSVLSGKYEIASFRPTDRNSSEFMRGWLSGYLAGDGCIHKRNGQTNITITSRDVEMLDIYVEWAKQFGCNLRKFKHKMGNSIFPAKLDSVYIDGIQCTSGKETDKFLENIDGEYTKDYCAGWLAGMYDSDGTLDAGGSCRIIQSAIKKYHNVEKLITCLENLGLHYNIQYKNDGVATFIINQASFLLTCRPMMQRKYPKFYHYKSLPKNKLYKKEEIQNSHVYDIETETHSFICEGFIVHNCESGRLGVIWDRFVRYETLENVENQLREIAEQGFTGVGFYDDILPLNKKRTLELLEIIKKYNLKWRCFLRTDIINNHGGKEYLQAMRDAGLIEIFVGIESADNQIKANIHKGTTIEQDENVLQWCRELGITFKGSIIIGLPGESRESLEKTRNWILSQNPEGIRIQTDRLIPFTGTPLTKQPEKFDLTYEMQPDEEWFYKGRHDITSHSFVSTSHLTADEIDVFWRELEAEMERRGFRQ